MAARPFAYQPALDGLRAVSIGVVLAFHLGAPGMAGGYLGVSVFFTLSGFLITSLLLDERERTGTIAVRSFYVRRLRRLLPASLLCLSLVVAGAAVGLVAERTDLRTSLLAALAQVANWEALLGDRSYADLFVAPSPVAHFWSLAIEEQFYWLWPVAMLGITAMARRRGGPRSTCAALVALFLLLSASAPLTARWLGGNGAYFASWARFAEILAGAALAAVVAQRDLPARVRHLAAPCLGLVLLLSVVTPSGRGWAYAGGLPLFSLVTVGLIAGLQADGPVRRVLSWRPLVAVGLVSYGLYLFHWPVFAVLDTSRTGLDGLGLAGVRMAVTVAITVISYRWVERPLRSGVVLPSPRAYLRATVVATPALGALVVLLVPVLAEPAVTSSAEPIVITAAAPPHAPAGAVSAASASLAGATPRATERPAAPAAAEASAPAAPEAAPAAAASAPEPRTVALFGDSIADWLLVRAAATFDRADVVLVDAAQAGCDGAVDLPAGRDRHGRPLPLPGDCQPWTQSYPRVLEDAALDVDVAVLVLGQAPTVDRLVDGRWMTPCEGIDWYLRDLEERVRYARRHADEVVFVLPSWGGTRATWGLPDDHLLRVGCIRAELEVLTARMALPTIDLAEALCPAGPVGACLDRHEVDGTHVDAEDSPFVLRWLLDRALQQ